MLNSRQRPIPILAKEKGRGNGKNERGQGHRQEGGQSILVLQGNAYDNFINAIHTKATKRLYTIALRKFMEFQGVEHVGDLLPSNNVTGASLIQASIIHCVNHLKTMEKLGPSSCKSYVPGVLLFFDMNDVTLNKRKINKCLQLDRKINQDRPYTREEIAKLLTFCGPRERTLVLLLASTGMRVGGSKVQSFRLLSLMIAAVCLAIAQYHTLSRTCLKLLCIYGSNSSICIYVM